MDYKDKLKLAKEALDSGSYDKETIEYIFPELAESEDERISREITEFILTHRIDEPNDIEDTNSWLVWLEKQGEKKANNDFKAEDWYVSKVDGKIHNIKYGLEKQGEHESAIEMKSAEESLGISSEEYNDIVNECLYGESKSADKVEPKFKVRNWIACEGLNTALIVNIDDDRYEVELIDGNKVFPHIDYIDRLFHLWTIADAKDGDILWHSDTASNGVFIFKEIRHDGKVLCYCDYDSEDHFCTGEYHTCCWSNDKSIKPATKKQRDHLFEKMKEAGYKWDAEKKVLKRFEKRGKQKWSERDDKNLAITIGYLQGFPDDLCEMSALIKWLKGLKERIK